MRTRSVITMFCPNCGKDCGNAKFCSECGTKLEAQNLVHADAPKKTAPKSIYQPVIVNGQKVDLFKVVCKYGVNNERAYSYLKRQFGIPKDRAKELLAPYYAPINASKPSFNSMFSEAANELAERRASEIKRKNELEASGQIYCPKCLSTNISANQKGFSFIRGALGANIALDVALIAGGIGSKKIICTCLKCGYQWKPGKK